MNSAKQRWMIPALGVLLFVGLGACIATGPGYGGGVGVGYIGGVYEPNGYDYGGWGGNYQVGPPRGHERRPQQPQAHAYRAAPYSRPIPSIPTRPGRPWHPTHPPQG
jgi:hypothetical protein